MRPFFKIGFVRNTLKWSSSHSGILCKDHFFGINATQDHEIWYYIMQYYVIRQFDEAYRLPSSYGRHFSTNIHWIYLTCNFFKDKIKPYSRAPGCCCCSHTENTISSFLEEKHFSKPLLTWEHIPTNFSQNVVKCLYFFVF